MTILLVNNLVGVQLPDWYFELQLYNGNLIWVDEKGLSKEVELPPAQYKLICVWPKVSEDGAAVIVEECHWANGPNEGKLAGYMRYRSERDHTVSMSDYYPTALASLQSLLTSKGLSGTVAILESTPNP